MRNKRTKILKSIENNIEKYTKIKEYIKTKMNIIHYKINNKSKNS